AEVGWTCPRDRRQYIPVTVTHGEGTARVRPAAAGGSGSHLVASLARAQGLAVVPAEVEGVHPGDALPLLEVMMG
ncbi:molybdopterin molybdenumtransferase MoeA, partial [Georgenia sp. 10Sc9-8]|nr:molybdopterin molybdenumtransferase MoeA [Georgenia halotolerans]